jgi:hypothetical protein
VSNNIGLANLLLPVCRDVRGLKGNRDQPEPSASSGVTVEFSNRSFKMKRFLKTGAAGALMLCAVTACTNPNDPGQRTIGGALIGAGSGAALGAIAGGGPGAAIGALAGGAVGAATGYATTPPPPRQRPYYPPSSGY